MIKGFKDEATQAVFNGESLKGFPSDLLKVARRKLRYLNAAAELGDLRAPPGHRLEALKGAAPVSTRSGSTTSSGFVSYGRGKGRQGSRLRTTTEERISDD
jgi:hypothetical protein